MKKTAAKNLSLTLALILVSSLSSGVILAKGPSDNASDRGKERARYHKMRQVGVLECLSPPNATGLVTFFDGPDDIILPMDAPDETCLANLNFLVNKRFQIEGIGTFIAGAGVLIERYTVVRTIRMRREKDED